MSANARAWLFRPHWLAAASGLTIGWLLYRPIDEKEMPPVLGGDRYQMEAPLGDQDILLAEATRNCPENSCALAPGDAPRMSAPVDSDPGGDGAVGDPCAADEGSIYGVSACPRDPFAAAAPPPLNDPVATTIYTEPVEPAASATTPCVVPVSLQRLESSQSPPRAFPAPNTTAGELAQVPSGLPCTGLPKTCTLTDCRSGVPVATLTIAAEVRSETLDLSTYQHVPQVLGESESSMTGVDDTSLSSACDETSACAAEVDMASYETTMSPPVNAEPIPVELPDAHDDATSVSPVLAQSQQWLAAGQVNEAVDLLSNALFENPHDVSLLQQIAVAYLAKHDLSSALAAAEQSLRIDRGNPLSHEVMSEILRASGQANRAKHYADQALFLRSHPEAAASCR